MAFRARTRSTSARASTCSRTRSSRAANGACAIMASRRSASGSARRTMPTTKSVSKPGRPRSARASPTGRTKAASRCSICRSRRRSASLRGAVGTQFGQRKIGGDQLRRRFAARSGAHQQHRGILVRGTAGHQAAAAAGGGAHRADVGRRHRAGADCAQRRRRGRRRCDVQAGQRQRRHPLRAADGHRGAADGAVRRAGAGGCRAVLQGRARGDRDVRDRQSLPREGDGTDDRAGIQESQRLVPVRCLGVLHEIRRFHFQAAHRTIVRRNALRRAAPAPSSIRSCSSSAMRPSPAPRSRRSSISRRIWRGVWGIDGQYDFVLARFDDAQGGNLPRIPPHRAGAGVYYRDTNWFARVGLPACLRPEQDRRERDADRGLHAAERRPGLHVQARRPGQA